MHIHLNQMVLPWLGHAHTPEQNGIIWGQDMQMHLNGITWGQDMHIHLNGITWGQDMHMHLNRMGLPGARTCTYT